MLSGACVMRWTGGCGDSFVLLCTWVHEKMFDTLFRVWHMHMQSVPFVILSPQMGGEGNGDLERPNRYVIAEANFL